MAQLSFLEFDGATSYAMVWVNEKLVGGWPYGDNTLRLDISEYLNAGENSIAMRLDNLQDSGRWYPGGGLYRNVWLVTASSTRVAHYGTYITTRDVLGEKATIELQTRAGTWTGSVDGTAFPSEERDAFNSGLALAIVKATPGSSGGIIVSAAADGLQGAAVVLHAAA